MPVKFKLVAFAANTTGATKPHVPPIGPPTAVIFVSISVNAATGAMGFGLVKVNVTVEVPPAGIEFGLNAFAIVGVLATVMSTSSLEATHGALLIVQRNR